LINLVRNIEGTMSLTEKIIAEHGSFGTYGNLMASAILAERLLATDEPLEHFVDKPTTPNYKAIEASGSSSPACQINIEKPRYKPRTSLGEKLIALREKAIANGLRLLDADEIIDEIRRRRGEIE